MRARLLIASLLLPAVLFAQSDPRQPISSPTVPTYLRLATSASGTTARPGAKISLFVDIVPNPGIHVYAPGAKDYVPIALTLGPHVDATLAKTTYPKSELLLFAPLSETVPVYQKAFRLAREVSIRRSTKPGTVLTMAGTVDYQACDDKVCFLPESVPVSWTIAISR